jgi:hypothetical protein
MNATAVLTTDPTGLAATATPPAAAASTAFATPAVTIPISAVTTAPGLSSASTTRPTALPATHLAQRALLARLNISQWTGRRADREITHRIASEHGADRTAACFTKTLIPRSFLARIAETRGTARAAHLQLTLPWTDHGFRILPVDLHLEYMNRLSALRADFQIAVAAFLAAFDEAKAAARTTLGTLYRDTDYPASADLRGSFAFAVQLQPLPAAHDWRIDLPAAEADQLRRDLQTRLDQATDTATANLFSRFATALERLLNTLADPATVLRGSLIHNLRELCRLVPALNLTADPDLDALTRDIETRLANLDPATLRRDPAARRAAADEAADLLDPITARLATYTGVRVP